MSNSLFGEKNNNSNADKINYAKKICEQLREHYKNKVNKDAELLQIFGTPENFIKYLKAENYKDTVQEEIFCLKEDGSEEAAKVILGIETAESQVDINKIRKYFNAMIDESKNINFKKNSRVLRVQQEYNSLVQTVELASGELLRSACVINCAWQNIEKIAKASNIFIPSGTREVRAKISIRGILPKELKEIHTRIFSIGPHASITNLYESNESERSAIITYEPITNALFFDPVTIEGSQKLANFKRRLDNEEKKEVLVQSIINGTERYTKHMGKVIPVETRVGYVKVFTKEGDSTSIYDPKSIIHSRTDEGVEEFNLGHFACHGMKATYIPSFAQNTFYLFEKQHERIQRIKGLIANFKKNFNLDQEANNFSFLINTLLYVSLKNYWDSVVDLSELEGKPSNRSTKDLESKLTKAAMQIIRRIKGLQWDLNEEIKRFPNERQLKSSHFDPFLTSDFPPSFDTCEKQDEASPLSIYHDEFSSERENVETENSGFDPNEIAQIFVSSLKPEHFQVLANNPSLIFQVYQAIKLSISPPKTGKNCGASSSQLGLFAEKQKIASQLSCDTSCQFSSSIHGNF